MRSPLIITFTGIQLFFWLVGSAQKDKVDSLKMLFAGLRDTARIDVLNQVSQEYIHVEKKDSAEYYAEEALNASKAKHYIHGIAVALIRKARIAKHFADDLVTAEKLGKESLSFFEKSDNKIGIDEVYFELMFSIFGQTRYDESLYYAQKRYDWAVSNGNNDIMLDALGNLGAIYKDMGNYEKSFGYSQQIRQLAITTKNLFVLSCIPFGLGELCMKIEDYETALKYFREGLKLETPQFENLRKIGDWDIWVKMEYSEIFSHLNQFDSAWHYLELYKPKVENDRYYRVYLVSSGEYYLLQKKYDLAVQNFLTGLYFHRKLSDRNEVQRTLILVAKGYLGLRKYDSAMQYSREALALATVSRAKQIIRDAYSIIHAIYDHYNKSDSANYYFRQYITMKDTVNNDQTRAKFAAYNYEQQITLISKEKEINHQQLKIKNQQIEQVSFQKKILVAGVIALFVIGALTVISIMLKRRNERQQLEHEIEIQKLAAEKTNTDLQKEAARLEMQALRAQMNPHFIFNSLNSINMFILENNKLQASEYLSKFSKLIRLILQNSQEPFIPLENELDALQLYLQLESLRFDKKFDFTIDVANGVDTTTLKVPPLIIQPYAENAIWHGLMHKKEKGHLSIQVHIEKEMLFYRITDDGVGRKKAAELTTKSASGHKSMGMRITTNRLAMIQQHNATSIEMNDLALPDGMPGGTEVLIKIPVHYD